MRTYSTIGIMNHNNKWGSVTITLNSNGYVATVPQSCLFKSSKNIKKGIYKRLQSLTIEDVILLYKKGVVVTTS